MAFPVKQTLLILALCQIFLRSSQFVLGLVLFPKDAPFFYDNGWSVSNSTDPVNGTRVGATGTNPAFYLNFKGGNVTVYGSISPDSAVNLVAWVNGNRTEIFNAPMDSNGTNGTDGTSQGLYGLPLRVVPLEYGNHQLYVRVDSTSGTSTPADHFWFGGVHIATNETTVVSTDFGYNDTNVPANATLVEFQSNVSTFAFSDGWDIHAVSQLNHNATVAASSHIGDKLELKLNGTALWLYGVIGPDDVYTSTTRITVGGTDSTSFDMAYSKQDWYTYQRLLWAVTEMKEEVHDIKIENIGGTVQFDFMRISGNLVAPDPQSQPSQGQGSGPSQGQDGSSQSMSVPRWSITLPAFVTVLLVAIVL